ncbi:hypothetical protein AKO1_014445 [Acrasis kona]|uniref:Tetratricopeptide repeat protein n=1 Tax=Acrasis kona TaxID=1008807 RepID=A0AAW2YZD9_9EUKA
MNRVLQTFLRTTSGRTQCIKRSYAYNKKKIQEMYKLITNKMYSEMIHRCEVDIHNAIDHDPTGETVLDAIYFKSYAHAQKGEIKEALRDMEYLVFIHDPKNIPAILSKAAVLKVLGQEEERQELLRTVLERDPNNRIATFEIVKTIMKNRIRFKQELKILENVLSFQEKDIDLLFLKIDICLYLNKTDLLIGYYNNILEIDPNNQKAQFGWSQQAVLKTEPDVEENKAAYMFFKKFMDNPHNSNHKKGYFYKALSLYNLERYEDCIGVLERLMIISYSCNANILYGKCLVKLKRYAEAIDYFEAAIIVSKYLSPEAWKFRAISLCRIGMVQDAVESFATAINLCDGEGEPKLLTSLLLGKAYALARLKEWNETMSVCDIILEKDLDNLRAHYLRVIASKHITQ